MNNLKRVLQLAKKPIKGFQKTSLRNKIIIIACILVLSFLLVRQIQTANAEPQYITELAVRDIILEIVSETGNVGSSGKVDVFSTSNGVVEEVYVKNGDKVTVDTGLFKVKSTATEQEKATAYASYQSAATSLQQAENTLRDKKAILDKVLDDVKDHDDDETFEQKQKRTTAEVASDNAYDTVKSAKAQVSSTGLAYQATQNIIVKAPSSGTIANLSIEIGDKVSASATPALSIVSELSNYSVKLSLNEVDVPKVQVGQKASINLDAFPDKPFDGQVTKVDDIGTNAQGVVTYNIFITITNSDSKIKPGMTANVDIEVDKAENVLTVPNSAIKPYKGEKAVQIIDKKTNKPVYVPVKLGVRGIERTEITEGIEEGTQVITALQNGQVKRSGSTVLGGGR